MLVIERSDSFTILGRPTLRLFFIDFFNLSSLFLITPTATDFNPKEVGMYYTYY